MSRRTAITWLCGLMAAICAAPACAAPAVAQELAGSWRFDDGAGNVALDDGPFRLHAAWAAPGGPAWIGGVAGTALRFEGGDEVTLPDHSALEPARVTVAAWVRSAGSPGAYRYVFSKGASSCARSAYGLYTGPRGGAAFYVAGDGAFTMSAQVAAAVVWDGRWHRLAGTYDGITVRLYVDGEQVGTAASGPTHIEYGIDSRTPRIGSYRGACRLDFDGDIDALAVWRGARTASAIRADAVPPPETPASGPIGRAPGAPLPGDRRFAVTEGFTTTPAGCTSVRLSHRTLRAARRTRLVATVRHGTGHRRGVRVVLRAGKLRRAARTNARGRARFLVRPARRHRRLSVTVAVGSRGSCGTPVAYVRVRRS